ncbi:MAG: hypothetical protein K2W78_12810 [Xanthobacteraceae bacterium]|nr:hypothetical protein [Xanthobacteraceae bacterium]
MSERAERHEQAAVIFDAALALAKSMRPAGNLEIGGERKRLYEWRLNELAIELLEANPHREKPYAEGSMIKVKYEGRLVFEMFFDDDGVRQLRKLNLPSEADRLSEQSWLSKLIRRKSLFRR